MLMSLLISYLLWRHLGLTPELISTPSWRTELRSTYPLNKPFSVYYKPYVSGNSDLVGAGVRNNQRRMPYVRTDTGAAVELRGHHMFLQNNNMSATDTVQLDVFITFYMKLRQLK